MDYRRVDDNDRGYTKVIEKKEKLLKKLLNDHKKVKNHYNYIKNKQLPYNKEFIEIYNESCVYCGKTFLIKDDWEIDHFICEKSYENKTEAGKIQNLVLSCKTCNRYKLGFFISQNMSKILDIDRNGIANVFYRDKQSFKILINDEYKNDKEIERFYTQLRLDSNLRRLDYLILKLNYYIEITNKPTQRDKLNDILLLLYKKY